MQLRAPLASVAILAAFCQLCSGVSHGQTLTPVCQPSVSAPIIVATHDQIVAAGLRAEPPLTDTKGFGFAWPDTQMGVIKTAAGYEFFTSDGAFHPRQLWQGHWVGNNNYGSVVTTVGTLDNPLGTGNPQDVTISPNPDPGVNPNYSGYTYIGGGPVYQVPEGMTGAGNLLVGYHAELPSNTLYAVHGLAASWDNGLHWTDLGEVVRPNQSFAPMLAPGFDEIGDGPLVLSPDGKYFYLYFPDWTANGTLHTTNANGVSTTTNVSVARALAASVLDAAFGSKPHAVAFEKFYEGNWHLQPGVGGASSDLIPSAPFSGYLDIHYNSAIARYVLIISDDTNFAYAESVDLLHWSLPVSLGTFGPIAAYPTAVGLGDDPHVLGTSFYVYFTHLPADGAGWPDGELRRLTLSCP